MEVSWTEHALLALEDVFNYGSRFSQERSIDYTSELIDFCDALGDFPFKYPACEELPDPEARYRSAVFEKQYRVIYRVEPSQNRLYLLDIFHASRNPARIQGLRDAE
jgi:plasmid stabilization system protein ParE